jgi:cell division protein FtsB
MRALLVVIGAWIAYGVLFGDAGLARILSLKREERRLEAEISRLEQEADDLKQRRERLESDPAYVEKVAREEYLLAHDDELVFRFRDTAE